MLSPPPKEQYFKTYLDISKAFFTPPFPYSQATISSSSSSSSPPIPLPEMRSVLHQLPDRARGRTDPLPRIFTDEPSLSIGWRTKTDNAEVSTSLPTNRGGSECGRRAASGSPPKSNSQRSISKMSIGICHGGRETGYCGYGQGPII